MKYDPAMSWLGTDASPASLKIVRSDLATIASAAPFLAPKGTWFDEAVDFREPEGDAFTKAVLKLLAIVETRDRKRRKADEINHYTIVRKILANGLRCHHYRAPSLVAYQRKADSYNDGPVWLSGKAMRRTADLLEKTGLLRLSLGEPGTASTYEVTLRLYELALEHGVTSNSLTLRLPPERLVRVRRSNAESPFVSFKPTETTRHWTARLEAYNAFLAQHDITLDLTGEEEVAWAEHWNQSKSRGGMPFYRPELIQTDLYRQFNNGSFEEGGRLYGGWWINAPKKLRQKIMINDQTTVELDFSGCAIRMLYHECGLDYRDDPYRLEGVASYETEKGLQPGHFREGIKRMTQALINDRSGGKPEMIALPGDLSFRPHFKRAEIRRMIEETHAPIAHNFGTGAGLRLQRKESDLALDIITALMERGIMALPIHDSFIAPREKRVDLEKEMKKQYYDIYTFYPIVN